MSLFCKLFGHREGPCDPLKGATHHHYYCVSCNTHLRSITVDAGNQKDTLGVNQTSLQGVAMSNTSAVNWQLAAPLGAGGAGAVGNYASYTNTVPLQAAVYYGNPQTQTVWYTPSTGGQPGLQVYNPYNQFDVNFEVMPGAPLLPEPAFSEEQIEEALEFINGG